MTAFYSGIELRQTDIPPFSSDKGNVMVGETVTVDVTFVSKYVSTTG